jgi:hypothetical protein
LNKKSAILLTTAVLIVFFFLAKDIIVRIILERTVESLSGLRISMDSVNVGVLNTSVRVRGLTIFNPASFPDKMMARINHLYVDYDITSGLRREIHIRDMIFDVGLVNVVKNAKGENNLNSLKVVKSLEEIDKGKKAKNGLPRIRIDRLHLKGDKVVYKNYAAAPYPAVTEFECKVDERYENITNPYQLVSLIVSRSLVRTSPSTIIGFDLAPLQNQFHGAMSHGIEAIKNTYECLLKKTEAR